MRLFPVFAMLALLILTSCAQTERLTHAFKIAEPPPRPQGTFKVGEPYKVEGKWYQPREVYSYSEAGIASWYGPGFQGKRTANGEKFDKNELTAAHRTLQMPSLVRVTNLDNGRSLIVRINDRGPFKRGRMIDVSEKAAELLGFKGRGTAKVRVDLLADESKMAAMAARRGESTRGIEVVMNQRPHAPLTALQAAGEPVYSAPAPEVSGHVRNGSFFPDPVVTQQPVHPTSIYVQVGSFSQQSNAGAMVAKLGGFGKAQVFPAMVGGKNFFRVRVGPIRDVPAADALLARLGSAGYKQAIIIVD